MKKLKKIIRELPVIGPIVIKSAHAVGYKRPKTNYTFKRVIFNGENENFQFIQTTNLLNYSKTSGSFYAASNFPAGYHTLKVLGKELKGRRNPKQRLEQTALDFKNKSVLDIGSNQGGMLFEITDQIKWGVGIDYDHRMVNVSNKITQVESIQNLDFFTFNLENEPLGLINDFLPEKKVDIIFLLAVCRWIKNWREVIDFCAEISDNLLIETNGSDEQQAQQKAYFEKIYTSINPISKHSSDDPERDDRKLFICKK